MQCIIPFYHIPKAVMAEEGICKWVSRGPEKVSGKAWNPPVGMPCSAVGSQSLVLPVKKRIFILFTPSLKKEKNEALMDCFDEVSICSVGKWTKWYAFKLGILNSGLCVKFHTRCSLSLDPFEFSQLEQKTNWKAPKEWGINYLLSKHCKSRLVVGGSICVA